MLSKILNSKITKITAIILLPTILVGGYYGVKWVIKKKKESDLNESIKIPYIPSDLKLNFNTSDKKRD